MRMCVCVWWGGGGGAGGAGASGHRLDAASNLRRPLRAKLRARKRPDCAGICGAAHHETALVRRFLSFFPCIFPPVFFPLSFLLSIWASTKLCATKRRWWSRFFFGESSFFWGGGGNTGISRSLSLTHIHTASVLLAGTLTHAYLGTLSHT
jgi:hypothetical protein